MAILVSVLLLLLSLLGALLFVLFFRVSGETFDSAGVPIHFTDQGSGTPVILVHGFAVQSDLNWRWPGCVRRLKRRGYRVITMDVRGHGRSGKSHDPREYGVALSDDIIRLMDHLGIEKAHIAGYSMGGFIVLKTIERHPDRLLSGVICAAGWGVLNDEHRALFAEIVRAIEKDRSFDPITHWIDMNKHAPWLNCFLSNFFMRNTNDLDAIVNVFRTFEALTVEEDALRRNTVPALTLVGARDGIREASDKLPGVMANHELVHIPGGDHLTAILHPLFMSQMLAFLDRHSPA
jgi:pimeloyl-ACP methyl ester carboxylesterase